MLGSGQIRLRLFRSGNPETQKLQSRFSKKNRQGLNLISYHFFLFMNRLYNYKKISNTILVKKTNEEK